MRKAVVVGGGIGGLAAANALHRAGWCVTVLERAPRFTEIGAGLSLWPNAMAALDTLGLADKVRRVGAVETSGGVRDRAGHWLSRTDNAEIERRHHWPLLVVHRAELLRILQEALPGRCLSPATEVDSADGLDADLVVAADGLNSTIRRRHWAQEPRYAGYTAWRAITAPLPHLQAEGAVLWGRGERVGYTVMPGDRYYLFATANGRQDADPRTRFATWPDPIPALLEATGTFLRHDVCDLPALPSFVSGKIALLGDAAHAMDPILGQGACQAIEDAVTLAACLEDRTVPEALQRYDQLRRPRTQAVARRAARLGQVAQWSWPPAVLVRDLAARLIPDGVPLRSMAPILGWTADA